MKKQIPAWLTIIILTFIPLIMVLGNSVLIPGFPVMQSRMHVTKFQISLLITLFSVPAGLVIPISGFLSDRLSRKWIVVPSLLLFGAGGVLSGIAAWWLPHPYPVVLGGRILQGIGASGTAPIAMAWVGDLFTGSERSKVLGINEAGNAFGKVISPIVGAAVAVISWFAVFFIFPALCLPIASAVWWLLPSAKPREPQTTADYLKSVGTVFRKEGRWLVVSYLCGAAALFTLFGVLFYLSDLLETRYHVGGILKGLILAIPLLCLSIVSFATGAVIKRRKLFMKWLLTSGLMLMSVVFVASIWLATNAWLLVALMSISALGTGIVLPCLNTFITSAVRSEQRGVVTSFYGSVRFLGVAFGPPVFTWLVSMSTAVMFFSVAGLTFTCALLAAFLVRPKPAQNKDTQIAAMEANQREARQRMGSRHKARV
ncbi:MAG: MFS transporter [Alicyclobacillus sp.]|nr:MFS transporter [Alicyclobacillus sp.]